jgi:hypothetical protein
LYVNFDRNGIHLIDFRNGDRLMYEGSIENEMAVLRQESRFFGDPLWLGGKVMRK